jgi:hypothetical protein
MHRPRAARIALVVLALALVGGCGSSDDDPAAGEDAGLDQPDATDGNGDTGDDGDSDGAGDAGDDPRDDPEAELPGFVGDFDRVCTTQVGFGGTAPYDDSAGPHPVVLFEEFDGSLIETSRTLPAGWTVTQDDDFEDNSELAAVQLVACASQVEATPNGTECELDSDGETVTLELVDTAYELAIFEAATGAAVGAPVTLEASSTECPLFVLLEEGEDTYENEPSDDDYIAALRDAVE